MKSRWIAIQTQTMTIFEQKQKKTEKFFDWQSNGFKICCHVDTIWLSNMFLTNRFQQFEYWTTFFMYYEIGTKNVYVLRMVKDRSMCWSFKCRYNNMVKWKRMLTSVDWKLLRLFSYTYTNIFITGSYMSKWCLNSLWSDNLM